MELDQVVSKFYLHIWLSWALRLTLSSLSLALVLSLCITFFLFAKQGFPTLTKELVQALLAILKF